MRLFGMQIGRAGAAAGVPAASRQRILRGGNARSFQAGSRDRLTTTWITADLTANMALLKHLRVMRARSRDFARNNEYGRKFFALVRTNVVGHAGFSLKFDCRRDD